MPKRSKKSKSKRTSLKQKYKVIKKVKDHHKKKAKEAKKLGLNRKSKVEKDPGIPNDWPFKEEELKKLEARRALELELLEQKKAARKERREKRKLGLLVDDDDTNLPDAEGKDDPTVSVSVKTKDNLERVFYKELVKVIEASDVILEVLDARDPLGTRCADMERMVMKAGADKHLVLLLNKIDLVPREAVEKWLKYLREELPAVAFKCSTQKQKSNLGWKSSKKAAKPNNLLQTSDCLGAETLLKLLKNYCRSHEIKKSITVGVIGLPNVGKSSLINSLKRCHVVDVGATPGMTRSMQEVHLDKNIKLLDCPGVVMLKSRENELSIALRNCKKIEKLEDPIGPVNEILKLCPARTLVTLYKLPAFESADDFLQKLATVRGKLKEGGVADVESAARIVLRDWNEGKIPYFTMPPVRSQEEPVEARIVSELGKVFDIDKVYSTESSYIGSLKPSNDIKLIEVPSNGPVGFDEEMLKDDVQPQASAEGSVQSNAMETDMAPEKAKSGNKKQNEKLYSEEGILNTKVKRAEKKRQKKASSGDNDDYDFKVDYVKPGSPMEADDEGGEDGVGDGSKSEEVVVVVAPGSEAVVESGVAEGDK